MPVAVHQTQNRTRCTSSGESELPSRSTILLAGKGGAGKSTLTSNVAVALAERDLRVVVVDCDPANPSIGCWKALRTAYKDANGTLKTGKPLAHVTVVTQDQSESQSAALDRAERHARTLAKPVIIILDLPTGDRSQIEDEVWLRADVVYLPVEPNATSVSAVSRLLSTFTRPNDRKDPFKCVVRCIVNRFASERRRQDAVTALGEGLVANNAVRGYVAYADAFALGLSVIEYEPRSKAADDVRSVAADAIGVLKALHKKRQESEEMT